MLKVIFYLKIDKAKVDDGHLIFEGSFTNDIPNQSYPSKKTLSKYQRVLYNDDKDIYEGYFVEKDKQGWGKLRLGTDFYEGEFINDLTHGYGIMSQGWNNI